jgi:hypothetical protein
VATERERLKAARKRVNESMSLHEAVEKRKQSFGSE